MPLYRSGYPETCFSGNACTLVCRGLAPLSLDLFLDIFFFIALPGFQFITFIFVSYDIWKFTTLSMAPVASSGIVFSSEIVSPIVLLCALHSFIEETWNLCFWVWLNKMISKFNQFSGWYHVVLPSIHHVLFMHSPTDLQAALPLFYVLCSRLDCSCGGSNLSFFFFKYPTS